MKETLLLFNPPQKEELLRLEMALFPLRIRMRRIQPENYNQPLGVLAGVKDMKPADGSYEGEELPDTLFVFCGFTDSRLNQVLAALRRCSAGPFPYKAILTPTNQEWTAPDCFQEIRREHEAMHGK